MNSNHWKQAACPPQLAERRREPAPLFFSKGWKKFTDYFQALEHLRPIVGRCTAYRHAGYTGVGRALYHSSKVWKKRAVLFARRR
jgi:hypothetical protein